MTNDEFNKAYLMQFSKQIIEEIEDRSPYVEISFDSGQYRGLMCSYSLPNKPLRLKAKSAFCDCTSEDGVDFKPWETLDPIMVWRRTKGIEFGQEELLFNYENFWWGTYRNGEIMKGGFYSTQEEAEIAFLKQHDGIKKAHCGSVQDYSLIQLAMKHGFVVETHSHPTTVRFVKATPSKKNSSFTELR